jgi:translation initiation factor 2-alpha kinase 4
VKNKLDDQTYAIKRIRLNSGDKMLNKKIMREVKLLSRLNHENVVRWVVVLISFLLLLL